MLKMNFDNYSSKVLEFLSLEMAEKFNQNIDKKNKIIKKIIKEKISNFGELIEMEKKGDFDYYFSKPDISSHKLIFKDGSLKDSQKYLLEIINKISDILEND